MYYSPEEARRRRDKKVYAVMHTIAPLWLRNDEYRADEESCLFDLVYPHSVYGWVEHRYKYDAFNDVLYHMGERNLTETEALTAQETEPYLNGEVATTVPNQPLPRKGI